MYDWLLFDADGTIYDFDAAAYDAVTSVFAHAGIAATQEHRDLYARINHGCWLELELGELSAEMLRAERFRRLLSQLDIPGDAEDLSQHFLLKLSQGNEFITGARDLLWVLHTRFNMLLITNGLSEVQRPRFAARNMSRFFKEIVISDEVGVAKPDPAIFDICFERMGNPDRDKVLIIGDSLTSDMQGGITYGIDTCWFNPSGKPKPIDMDITFEIRNLYDLVPLL